MKLKLLSKVTSIFWSPLMPLVPPEQFTLRPLALGNRSGVPPQGIFPPQDPFVTSPEPEYSTVFTLDRSSSVRFCWRGTAYICRELP